MKTCFAPLSIVCCISLLLSSCSKAPTDEVLVPGRIADTKWFFHGGDTLLWVYSLYSTEHQEYSSSSVDRTSTYSHENSLFTVFKLEHNALSFLYRQEAGCIDHQACGTRYTDRIIAWSSDLLAFNCYCEGKLSIIAIPTGKEWSNLAALKTTFRACAPGIIRYGTPGPSRPDVLEMEISDGTVVYLSLENKQMTDWDKSFDYGSEVNRGSRYGEYSGQKIYFAPNDGDHRAFLVVRPLKSGTSQDYKHRMGHEYWLNPILLNTINRADAYVKDNAFYVLHSKTWNDSEDRDLLSKVSTKGETLYTIELRPLGTVLSYVASENYIYITNQSGLHVYDARTGKKAGGSNYNDTKPPPDKAA